jgi:hypothetical protein
VANYPAFREVVVEQPYVGEVVAQERTETSVSFAFRVLETADLQRSEAGAWQSVRHIQAA